jgi:hypothetical protein
LCGCERQWLCPVAFHEEDPTNIVNGDRHWYALELAEDFINRLLARYGPGLVIVHGGAPGIEQPFAVACRELGVTAAPHLADWKGLGNVGGPARNREMVEAGADCCIAFHRSLATGKGAKDCARQAIAAGIPTYLIENDEGLPRRVLVGDDRLR